MQKFYKVLKQAIMNIILVAEESAGLQTLKLLAKSDHNLKAVLTHKDSHVKGTGVSAAAQKLGYAVKPAKLVKSPEFASWITEQEIDLLLNVHSLVVICPEVIESVRFGAFNFHPGPLPKYAGLNAPSWAIYNGETQHGVTLHRITNKIDAGDIIDEAVVPVTESDTGLTLSAKCVTHGLPLIEKFLEDLHNPDTITTRKQNHGERVYYSRNNIPGGGKINWNSPAGKIDAFVRACNYSPFQSPWGHPKTNLGDLEISILKTEITDIPGKEKPGTVGKPIDGKAAISTADNWITVKRCFVDGKHVEASEIIKPGSVLG